MTPFFQFLQNDGLAKAKSLAGSVMQGKFPAGDLFDDGVFVVAAAAEIEDALLPLVTSLNFDSCLDASGRFYRNSENLGLCPFCKAMLFHSIEGLHVECTRPTCRMRQGLPVGIYWELESLHNLIDPVYLTHSRIKGHTYGNDLRQSTIHKGRSRRVSRT
jgi:hypothetical protein